MNGFMINPKRGELWLVDLNPTIGQEIQKTRPVVVISSDFLLSIPMRIIIPITSWQEKFINRPFMVKILLRQKTILLLILGGILYRLGVFRLEDLQKESAKYLTIS
jgi:mRNA-degrading endonuclease toxin of MazEF toxin-antitoxin module